MATNPGGDVQERQNRGRAYPNPPPKPGISARLERVRAHMGYRSKRAFWQKLCDGWDKKVSYEAVRNYHYDREPPPSYLARVADVFPDVRLEWLVAGDGEMLHSEQAKKREPFSTELKQLEARHPFLKNLPTGAKETFLDLWLAYRRQVPGAWRALRDIEGGDEVAMELADDLLFLITLPLRAWGFEEPTWLTGRAVETMQLPWREPDYTAYFRLQILALSLVMKLPNHGDRLNGWQESTVPTLRRFDEGRDPQPSEALQSLSATVQEQLDGLEEQRRTGVDRVLEEQRQRMEENVQKGQHILPYAEDLPPVEPVKPLTGSDLIACDYCDAKVRGDEYREHVESEHAGEAPR